MKISIVALILVTLFYSTSAQSIELNGCSVTLPAGLKKITMDEAKQYGAAKFKDNVLANNIIDMMHAELYRSGDILVSFNSSEKVLDATHLTKIKDMTDHAFRADTTYKGEIKRMNDNIVLTTNTRSRGFGNISIFADNADHTKTFSGTVIYVAVDKGKADGIADYIINHLRFKD